MESSIEALPTCAKKEVLFETVKDILDELTDQKIEMLENRIKCLSIDTEEQLKGVVDLVFEKVLEKSNFCVVFANLCRRLAMKKVPSGSEDNNFVNFRKLLINKCQKEFERDPAEDFARFKRITDFNPDELHKELTDLKRTLVQRSLANIKFIGELFKLHMLTVSIMHHCIKILLIKQDDDSLKCLCTLLVIIGEKLDSDNHCEMNKYFEQMQEIINKRQISTRIRFMLQDLIDLRQNNWTSHDVYESIDGCIRIISKTTNTIKKVWKFLEDISTTTELQCTNNNFDSILFYGKSHGTSSKTVYWTKQNPDDESKQQIKTVLNQDEEFSDDDDGSYQKIDKMVDIETQKTEVVSDDCRVETLELALKENPYLNDETEIEKRAELLFQEYFENTDLQNTITSLSENFASTTISSFVSFAFDNVLKTTTHRRKNIGQLMSDLIKAELMPVEDFVKGLESFLIIAKQYINDIPNVWEYVGELIAPSIDDEVLPLPLLQEAVKSCFESGSVDTVISAVLNATPMNLTNEAIQQRLDINNKISDGTPKTQIEAEGGDTRHSQNETGEQVFVTVQKITTEQHMDQIPSTCIRKCSRAESKTVTEDAICASQSIPHFLNYSLKCVLGQITGTTPLYDVVRLLTHFHAILCLSKEHKIDVSLSWDDLTELIEPFIKNESLPHSFLLQTSDLCFKPGCIDCLCSFLSIFSRGISEQLSKELNEKNEVRRSETKGSQFLPADLNTASKFAKKQVNEDTVIFKVGPGSENIGSSNLNDDCGSRIKRTNFEHKSSQFTNYQENDSSRRFNRNIPFSSRNLYQGQDTRNVEVPRRDRNAVIQLHRARAQAVQRIVRAKEQCSNSEQ